MSKQETDFGFLAARFMRFYGYTLDQLHNSSITAFWFLLNQIHRIQAEQDLRTLAIHMAVAGGSEGVLSRQEELVKELGIVTKGINTTFDSEGWEELKTL